MLWYSTHCPIVMEWLTARDRGAPMRPIDPPEHAGDPCRWYVYKTPGLTRPEHFVRMGLPVPAGASVIGSSAGARGGRASSRAAMTDATASLEE